MEAAGRRRVVETLSFGLMDSPLALLDNPYRDPPKTTAPPRRVTPLGNGSESYRMCDGMLPPRTGSLNLRVRR